MSHDMPNILADNHFAQVMSASLEYLGQNPESVLHTLSKQDNLSIGIARILPWGVQILNFQIKFPKFVEISNLKRKSSAKQLWPGGANGPLHPPGYAHEPEQRKQQQYSLDCY